MTTNKLFTALLTTLLFLVTCLPRSHAADLSAQQIERYMASVPALQSLGERHADRPQTNIDPSRPLSSSLEQMSQHDAAYLELSELARQHGFKDAQQWANVGDRIMQAYLKAKQPLSHELTQNLYQQGINNVKNDPNLSQTQKDIILRNMEKSFKANTGKQQETEQDIAAIRPYMKNLENIFE